MPDTERSACQWRAIPGFARYEVSSAGEIRQTISTKRRGPKPKGGVLAARLHRTGYLVVSLYGDDGKRFAVLVHRVVATAFLGQPPSADHQVAHNNGRRTDNRPANLRWASRAENMADIDLHGTRATGAKHGAAKLTAFDVAAIRQLREGGLLLEAIAARFGVHSAHVSRIVNRKLWA